MRVVQQAKDKCGECTSDARRRRMGRSDFENDAADMESAMRRERAATTRR
jgi:hypothetical protein